MIVPARDADATLPRTLEALAGQDAGVEYEVIVVDDGSRDRTADVARAAPGPVTLLQQDGRGPGEARNRGVAAAAGHALAFCDADVFPTPSWLRKGLRALTSADLVQGQVVPDPTVPLGPFDRSLWVVKLNLWETANLFVTRDIFDRVGGFEDWLDVEIGKAMAEDVLFGWRACRAGARPAFSADALAHHAVFPRGRREYIAERRRLRYFPAMAKKTPELRPHFFFARLFLSRRSAALDAAVLAAAGALALWSPLPLVGALPYAAFLGSRAREFGRPLQVVTADIAADLVGLGALLRGSARYGSPVL